MEARICVPVFDTCDYIAASQWILERKDAFAFNGCYYVPAGTQNTFTVRQVKSFLKNYLVLVVIQFCSEKLWGRYYMLKHSAINAL